MPNFGVVWGGGIKFIKAFFDKTSKAGLLGIVISNSEAAEADFRFLLFLWTLSIASLISFNLSL